MASVTHAAFIVGDCEGTTTIHEAYEEAVNRGGQTFYGRLPGAVHGSLGTDAEDVLNRAMDVVLGTGENGA